MTKKQIPNRLKLGSFILLFFFGLSALVCPADLSAQSASKKGQDPISGDFAPQGLVRRHADFWKLIFTKYSKDHLVFHSRKYPFIIYSVLDFSEIRRRFSGPELSQKLKEEERTEVERIRNILNYLGEGRSPRNDFEQRIYALFKTISNSPEALFREATGEDQIRTQTGIKERFRESVVRSGRYMDSIEKIFKARGLPVEVARLPFVESSFDYRAKSTVGAAGIWQFMRATGRSYMRVDAYVDERLDPIVASRSAAKYLQKSYQKIGVWSLAVTSYNHGLGGVLRAINDTGSRDLNVIIPNYVSPSFGFASQNFYPSFVAAMEIEKHWRQYFPGLERDPSIKFDEVRLFRPVSYTRAVSLSGLSDEEFQDYNLALLKPITSGRVRIPSGFIVKVPQGTGRSFIQKLGQCELIDIHEQVISSNVSNVPDPDDSDRSKTYQVKRGDTLPKIAKKFSVSVEDLAAENNLDEAHAVSVGEKLRIPSGLAQVEETPKDAGKDKGKDNDKDRDKDKGNATKADAKAKADKGKPEQGQKPGTPAQETRATYKVADGDTIWSIASKLSVSLSDLRKVNNLDRKDSIKVGQELKIPGSPVAKAQKDKSADKQTRPALYTVKAGDTPSSIAKSNKTSVEELRKLNPKLKNAIKPGDKLRLK